MLGNSNALHAAFLLLDFILFWQTCETFISISTDFESHLQIYYADIWILSD